MTTRTRDDVLRALGRVIDPELGRDLVSLGIISDVQIENRSYQARHTRTGTAPRAKPGSAWSIHHRPAPPHYRW